MFDTHCHLYVKDFAGNLDKIITKSREEGIKYFMVPAESIETSKVAITLNAQYQDLYSAVGIHPTVELDLNNLKSDEIKLSELARDVKVKAFGETGLDYYRFKSAPDVQKEYLKMHIKLALKYEKALILHNRQSTQDLLATLNDNWQEGLKNKVVFHFASLEDELIEFANEFGCFLGIDGDITFDGFKQEQVKKVNPGVLVLETDSPLVLPEPLRSKKAYPNNPANLAITAEYLSDLLKIDLKELSEITTNNAKSLFGIS